jgi:eukaryotic-like serine/threonine-protein kinase
VSRPRARFHVAPGEDPSVTLRDSHSTGLPESVGHYRVLRKLGEGGMGVVYAARDSRLDRDVALKMIRAASGDPNARARLWREARAAARVSHPNVCQLFEVGEVEGELFLAMELLDGEPLATRIARGAVPVREALAIAIGMLGALESLHRQGIVHRDLKPSNVFLTAHGIKLLDFGLARWTDPDQTAADPGLTQTGMVLGTPRYMAPEQWQGAVAGPAADLFAVGAILFEMLAGKPAFAGESSIEIFQAVTRDQPPALAGGASIVAIDRVLQKALTKSPERRYASATEMARDLERASAAVDTRETPRVQTMTRLIALPLKVLRPDSETDFLATSLPDAITASLSGLGSLLVRSSALASRFSAENADLKAIADQAEVDVVLLGTMLRAGEQVRVTAQLVEAPSGTVLWSKTAQVPLRDLFQLQDDLTRQIVESLSLPLSSRERRMLQHDIPATAHAYELYLRANQLTSDQSLFPVARDLYRSCLAQDANYAPAWARLGRVCRVIAKYDMEAPEENLRLAEQAFQKALGIHPDLPIAHNLYTHFEVEELGNARGAIVRLLEQASARPSDPEIYAGLVLACRYGGLLDSSLAAWTRAVRLDPAVQSSIAYTHWFRGDYQAALDHDTENGFFVLYTLPMQDRVEETLRHCDRLETESSWKSLRLFLNFTRAALTRDREKMRAELQAFASSSFHDPEGIFYLGRSLSFAGLDDEAMRLLDRSVKGGFYCVTALDQDPWLDPVRSRADFAELREYAAAKRLECLEAFVGAGGEKLLGVAG